MLRRADRWLRTRAPEDLRALHELANEPGCDLRLADPHYRPNAGMEADDWQLALTQRQNLFNAVVRGSTDAAFAAAEAGDVALVDETIRFWQAFLAANSELDAAQAVRAGIERRLESLNEARRRAATSKADGTTDATTEGSADAPSKR